MSESRFAQPITQTVWAGAATGVTTPSAAVRVWDSPFCSAYGHVSAACTVTVLYSNDGVTFYASQNKQVLSGAADFGIDFQSGAEYVALQTSVNVTATGIISAKG